VLDPGKGEDRPNGPPAILLIDDDPELLAILWALLEAKPLPVVPPAESAPEQPEKRSG
jgi:hypothetical protein